MTKLEAIEILKLKTEDPAKPEVIKAFSRLSVRYPQQHFAERYKKLLEARDTLLRPDIAFRELLLGDGKDFSELDLLIGTDSASTEANSARMTDLQLLLRPIFLEGEFSFVGDDLFGAMCSEPMMADLARMLSDDDFF